MVNQTNLELARVELRIATARHQHKPVRSLYELAHELRLQQLRSEGREDWLELARREFARRWHEDNP